METRAKAAALAVFLLFLASLTHTAAQQQEQTEDANKDLCKDICSEIHGLDTYYDNECFCVLDHAPTETEHPVLEHALARGKERGMAVTTSVVGDDGSQSREERCLLGLASALRARASRARSSAFREPVVTVINNPAPMPMPLPIRQVAVVNARNAQDSQGGAGSSSGSAQQDSPQTVSVLTVAGPLPGPLPDLAANKEGARASQGTDALSAVRARLRQRAEGRAAAAAKAPGGLLMQGAASASAPRYAGGPDIVVAPVRTGATFLESPTGAFSSMAGAFFGPGQGMGQGFVDMPYNDRFYRPQQEQTVYVDQFPGVVTEGTQYMRSAAQQAADTGASAAHSAIRQATDFASAVTGAGLNAAKNAVDGARWAASSGLGMANGALSQADKLSSDALRSQMRAADESLSILVPSASSQTTSVLGQRYVRDPTIAQALEKALRRESAARYALENADSQARSAAPRGVLTDTAAAVENAFHNVATGLHSGAQTATGAVHDAVHGVASGVQSGASTAANAAQGGIHGVISGVQSGASTVADVAQDAYQGVASGVQSGASTLTGIASNTFNAAQGLVHETGHGLQHAAHQITGLGHSAAEHALAKAAAAQDAAKYAMQAAASQTIQTVEGVTGAAKDAAQSAQEEALKRVQDVAGQVQGQVQDAAGQVRGAVQDVAGQVRGTVQDVAGQSAQAVRGVNDAVKNTVLGVTGEVRGQVQDLQQAVKGSVLDAQNAARDAIIAAASQGASKSQQMSKGALDAAQDAVTAAIDKVKKAMNLMSDKGIGSARSAVGTAAKGLGALRSAYSNFQQGYEPQRGFQQGFQQEYPPQRGFQQGFQQEYPPQRGFQQGFQREYPPQRGFQQGFQSFQTSPQSTSSWTQQAIDGIASEAANAGLGAARMALDSPMRLANGAAQDGLGLAHAAVSSLPLGWVGRSAANMGLNLASGRNAGGSASWRWSPSGTSVSLNPEASSGVVVKHTPPADALHTAVVL